MDIPIKYQEVYKARKKFEDANHTIEAVKKLPRHYFRIIDEDSIIMDGVSDEPDGIPEFMIIGVCKILNVPCGCFFKVIDTSPWYHHVFDGWRLDEESVVGSGDHPYASPKEKKGYFIRDCTKCSIAAGFIASGGLLK